MAHKLKENCYKLPSEQEEEIQIKVKVKTKKEIDVSNSITNWSQDQQKSLEEALAKYPKGCLDRWDRIAEHVAGKTKVNLNSCNRPIHPPLFEVSFEPHLQITQIII